MARLERERQAIFNTNVSEAEKHRQWSQHKAKIEAYLASPASLPHEFAQHSQSLARTASHVGHLAFTSMYLGLEVIGLTFAGFDWTQVKLHQPPHHWHTTYSTHRR